MKNLKIGKFRSGVVYNGVFYEFDSIEYRNLFLIEKAPERTLLDLISKIIKQNCDNFTNNN